MITYEKLARKPKIFRSFTGLDVPEFDFLSEKIREEHETTERERLSRPKRKRKIGQGRKFALVLKDRLLMLLVYYRMYTSYTLAGFLFGLDQSNVCRDIRYLEPAVRRCIPIPQKKYADAKKATTLEGLERYFPELKIITDASEQQIPRPQDKKKRKTHYSGKKKRHTVKNQYTINLRGEIIHKPPHSPGRRHDYGMFKEKHPVLPEGLQTFGDLGYKGMENDFPEMNPVLPYKKRRCRKLTPTQREFNRCHARIRIAVEHTIAGIKKFRIMGEKFRNRLRRYDRISDIVCGLINFRIRCQELIVVP
ncbi:MAG: transposase family protein [Nitrosotalea sp.]